MRDGLAGAEVQIIWKLHHNVDESQAELGGMLVSAGNWHGIHGDPPCTVRSMRCMRVLHLKVTCILGLRHAARGA